MMFHSNIYYNINKKAIEITSLRKKIQLNFIDSNYCRLLLDNKNKKFISYDQYKIFEKNYLNHFRLYQTNNVEVRQGN